MSEHMTGLEFLGALLGLAASGGAIIGVMTLGLWLWRKIPVR